MKKLLRKHGKKVSVGLLAIALILSPILLPIAKAAGSDTCEIRYHYFFMEGENAWIESKFVPSSSSVIQVYDFDSQEFTDVSNNPSVIVQNNYTSQYALHFGIGNVMDKGTLYTAQLANSEGTNLLKNGSTVVNVDGAEYWGLLSDYGHNSAGWDGNFLAANSSLLSANNNFSMTSKAEFYNLDVPEGFVYKGQTMKPYWSDEEYEIYFNMYKNAMKAASGDDETITYMGGDQDYYFIHFAWTNNNTDNGYSKDYNEFEYKDSDSTDSLTYELNHMDEYNISDLIRRVKAASVSIDTDWNTQYVKSVVGNSSDSSIIEPTITRRYNNIQKPSSWYEGSGGTQTSKFAGMDVTDTYHWYFMPAIGTITFEAPADYCVSAGIEEEITTETTTTNPKTGIVSYSIIGTLLTGAASAYIYARKHNKFNKV